MKGYTPTLIGELSRSIATAYTMIRICVFADSSKEMLVRLLDINVKPDILEIKHPFNRNSVEALTFTWEDHEAILYCLKNNDKNLCSKGISLNMLNQMVDKKAEEA